MLFIWARAVVFARLNGMPLLAPQWTKVHFGPLLRGGRHLRLYHGYFHSDAWVSGASRLGVLASYQRVYDPPVTHLSQPAITRRLHVFREHPHWSDYFREIREHRDLIGDELQGMLSIAVRCQLESCARPVIGVHVRCGDFRPLSGGEDLTKVGLTRAPLSYFREMIMGIRQLANAQLPVTVFSDGRDCELQELLALPGVYRSGGHKDVVDMLLLARSKILVPAPDSTFSMWAAFLSEAPALYHPLKLHSPVRPLPRRQSVFEGEVKGPAADWPLLLRRNIADVGMKWGRSEFGRK